MKTLKQLIFLLSFSERKQAAWLLVMILIMALLDTIGVASIMPFMAVLTKPSLIETNIVLNTMFKASNVFGVETNQHFLFLLGALVFILLISSLSFKALTTYVQLRFVRMREYTIGKRLVEGYLHQPYTWFLNRNSADLAKTILSEVGTIVSGGMLPMIELISKTLVAIALLSLLIFTDPKLAFTIGFSLSIIYIIIIKFNYSFLNRIGKERVKANKERYTGLSEGFGAIKEIKVAGLEDIYVKRFSDPAKIFAKHQATSKLISQLPRYALEAIAFGGMLVVILYLMSKSGNFTSALPIITLYALAGYRLLPALQSIYAHITQLRFISPALINLTKDLKEVEFDSVNNKDVISSSLKFKKVINLINIDYEYPNSSHEALKKINISIPIRSIVGFVGATGSGKTTLVDIILGLHQPKKGKLKVDDQNISHNNLRAWQKSIGYVPQHIYLSDDTISANIAFGIDTPKINHEAVERAAKIANIHNFITNELSNKYQTYVGERGVRLSGGQKQRIGIARAMYHNPSLLILDEATSALDNQTEEIVMDSIISLSKRITIVLIAHRLDTVKKCDMIFQLNKGQIIGKGSYESFIKGDPSFNLNK